MSLWTPGGEVPVDRGGGPAEPDTARPGPGGVERPSPTRCWPRRRPRPGIDLESLSPDERAQLEDMLPEMAEAQSRLASTPAAQVLANHLGGIYELARIHLSQDPPQFDEASLAIDAFAAVLDAVEPRLGEDGAGPPRRPAPTRDGLRPAARAGRRHRPTDPLTR